MDKAASRIRLHADTQKGLHFIENVALLPSNCSSFALQL